MYGKPAVIPGIQANRRLWSILPHLRLKSLASNSRMTPSFFMDLIKVVLTKVDQLFESMALILINKYFIKCEILS